MHVFFLILVFVLVAGCAPSETVRPVSGPAPDSLAVYTAILRHYYSGPEVERLVVLDHTTQRDGFATLGAARMASVSPVLRESFVAADTLGPLRLDGPVLGRPVHRLSDAELRSLLAEPDDWERFRARYPGAPGYLVFSRVGFSPDGQEALVYVIQRCGDLCGLYYLVHLRRQEGEWSVVAREVVAAS